MTAGARAILIAIGLIAISAAPAAAERKWVGGSGVNSDWWWYGNGESTHGDYNDSNSPQAAAGAAHDSLANDPNAGMNQPGAAGNDDVAQAVIAMDAAEAKVEHEFESAREWTDAVAAFENAKRAYYQSRA